MAGSSPRPPAAHIAERGANYYTPALHGLEVHICPDPKRIIEFLPRFARLALFAVPAADLGKS